MAFSFNISVEPISLQSHRMIHETEFVLQQGQNLIDKAEEIYSHGYTTIDHSYIIALNYIVEREV